MIKCYSSLICGVFLLLYLYDLVFVILLSTVQQDNSQWPSQSPKVNQPKRFDLIAKNAALLTVKCVFGRIHWKRKGPNY